MNFPDLTRIDRREGMLWGILILVSLFYGLATERLGKRVRVSLDPELAIRLPVPTQILLAMGDAHLAANLAGFRVLVAETARMKADEYSVQAGIQRDISRLNPAHEDNYYIAAALLPWSGQLDAAQYVLKRAAQARPNDYQPLFYYGFNLYHFQRNPVAGAEALLSGVARAKDPQDQWALQNLAAMWIERGYSLGEAASRVDAMASAAPPGGFRKYLSLRAARLRDLDQLRILAKEFERVHGRRLASLDELVRFGLIESLPIDPLEIGFAIDESTGEPVFLDALKKRKK